MHILTLLAFTMNILLSNHFEAYTIVFESQIKNYFFCEYFSLMLTASIGPCSVEIPVMLAKSGCDDTSDK